MEMGKFATGLHKKSAPGLLAKDVGSGAPKSLRRTFFYGKPCFLHSFFPAMWIIYWNRKIHLVKVRQFSETELFVFLPPNRSGTTFQKILKVLTSNFSR